MTQFARVIEVAVFSWDTKCVSDTTDEFIDKLWTKQHSCYIQIFLLFNYTAILRQTDKNSRSNKMLITLTKQYMIRWPIMTGCVQCVRQAAGPTWTYAAATYEMTAVHVGLDRQTRPEAE